MTRRPKKPSYTIPKGVLDDPKPSRPVHNLRGNRENRMCYDLTTGRLSWEPPADHVPGRYDWDEDGTRILRSFTSLKHRPKHPTDFPPVRWWNDPSWVIPDGVERSELGMQTTTSMVEDGTYDPDIYRGLQGNLP